MINPDLLTPYGPLYYDEKDDLCWDTRYGNPPSDLDHWLEKENAFQLQDW